MERSKNKVFNSIMRGLKEVKEYREGKLELKTTKRTMKAKKTLNEKIAEKLAKITYPFNVWPIGFSEASQEALRNSAKQIIRMVQKR